MNDELLLFYTPNGCSLASVVVAAELSSDDLFFPTPTPVEAFLTGLVRWTDDLFDWRREFPQVARGQARLLGAR